MLAPIEHELPPPTRDDAQEVRCALELAVVAWIQGDRPGALRWLRGAARSARAGDLPDRADELARAVAELATELGDEEDTPRTSEVVPRGLRRFEAAEGEERPRHESEMTLRLDEGEALQHEERGEEPQRRSDTIPCPPPLPGESPALAPLAVATEAAPIPLARTARRTAGPGFDDDEPTRVRHLRTPVICEGPSSVDIAAARVAVFLSADRRTFDVTLLEPDEPPPSGAPVAMLVAPSSHDAQALAALLAKLQRD